MGRKAKFDEKVEKKGPSRKGKKRQEPVFPDGLLSKYSHFYCKRNVRIKSFTLTTIVY